LLNFLKQSIASITIGFSSFSIISFIQKNLEIVLYSKEASVVKSLLLSKKNKNETLDFLSTSALITVLDIQKIRKLRVRFHYGLIYFNPLYNLPVFHARHLARHKMMNDSSDLKLSSSLPTNRSINYLSRMCAESLLSVSLYLTDLNLITLILNEYYVKRYLPVKDLLLPINIPKNMQINTNYYFRK